MDVTFLTEMYKYVPVKTVKEVQQNMARIGEELPFHPRGVVMQIVASMETRAGCIKGCLTNFPSTFFKSSRFTKCCLLGAELDFFAIQTKKNRI